ncbi:MAG: hypothetical protein SVY15_05950 [Halobacteriota archaeon]|nr:hypothetical protein [Halobacteriota archaeon]
MGEKEKVIAEENSEKINRALRLSLNIDIPVREELRRVAEGYKGIDAVIESAKSIKHTQSKAVYFCLHYGDKLGRIQTSQQL